MTLNFSFGNSHLWKTSLLVCLQRNNNNKKELQQSNRNNKTLSPFTFFALLNQYCTGRTFDIYNFTIIILIYILFENRFICLEQDAFRHF